MKKHLILELEAPLMSFGGEAIDNHGVIRLFPSASMLTGLIANALGWRRIESKQHQSLQDQLLFAARIDRRPQDYDLRDYQTASGLADKSWTTRGNPEGRAGGGFETLIRHRYYHTDMHATIALRLNNPSESLTIEKIAEALRKPLRPLFIGRKPCLPTKPILAGSKDGETALGVLLNWPLDNNPQKPVEDISIFWPEGEGVADIKPSRSYMITDQRNWISGLHGGGRPVCQATIERERIPQTQDNKMGD